MNILWWHWLVLGFILIGLELVIPSFTIIWFGLGAVLVSILLALFPACPLSLQILTWSIASIFFTVIWFRFFNPRNKNRTFSGTAKDAVLGQTGLIIRGAGPYAKGVVKFQVALLGADEWPCMADEPLEIGDRVKVVDVEGHVMKVEKLKKGES